MIVTNVLDDMQPHPSIPVLGYPIRCAPKESKASRRPKDPQKTSSPSSSKVQPSPRQITVPNPRPTQAGLYLGHGDHLSVSHTVINAVFNAC